MLHIEPEQRIARAGAVYLGCRHIFSSVKLPTGAVVPTMTYDMEDFLKSFIERYRAVIGVQKPLRTYSTPFLAEDHRDAPSGAPGRGPVKECPWCHYTGSPSTFRCYANMDHIPHRRKAKAETSAGTEDVDEQLVSTNRGEIPDQGVLASVACSLLMKVLWAARLARPDLLRAVNHLATKVTKWTSKCDSMMGRLMGYIQNTLHLRMIGWVGDSREQLFPHFCADADLNSVHRN